MLINGLVRLGQYLFTSSVILLISESRYDGYSFILFYFRQQGP